MKEEPQMNTDEHRLLHMDFRMYSFISVHLCPSVVSHISVFSVLFVVKKEVL